MVEVPAGLGLGVADGAAGGAVVSAGLAGEQLEPRPLPDHQLQLPRGLEVEHRVPELDAAEADAVALHDLVARPQPRLPRQPPRLGRLDEDPGLLGRTLGIRSIISNQKMKTSLPYFGVKLSCVCLMFAYRKK